MLNADEPHGHRWLPDGRDIDSLETDWKKVVHFSQKRIREWNAKSFASNRQNLRGADQANLELARKVTRKEGSCLP